MKIKCLFVYIYFILLYYTYDVSLPDQKVICANGLFHLKVLYLLHLQY